MREKNIRWDDDDFRAIEMAAKKEGVDLSNYIRRCTLLYTRQNHPEFFRLPNDTVRARLYDDDGKEIVQS